MKKKIAILCAVFAIFGAGQAFSVGLGLKTNVGIIGGWRPIGILISKNDDLHFSVSWWADGSNGDFWVTGDYWVFTPTLTKVSSGNLNFYVGPGAAVHLKYGDDWYFAPSLRVPVGLDLRFKRFDIFFEIAPSFELSIIPTFELRGNGMDGSFSLGGRFWI
jgi:hypothetical protein